MRHTRERIKRARERGRKMGIASQRVQESHRLEHAIKYGPARSVESTLIFEVRTNNPLSGVQHHIELRHEVDNGNNRFSVYLNGEKWRNQWSRWGFCRWLFRQIESVRIDWQ